VVNTEKNVVSPGLQRLDVVEYPFEVRASIPLSDDAPSTRSSAGDVGAEEFTRTCRKDGVP
jgi:hypothetical protein